jgi:hypothetical protein
MYDRFYQKPYGVFPTKKKQKAFSIQINTSERQDMYLSYHLLNVDMYPSIMMS